jgi:hypothetical protein
MAANVITETSDTSVNNEKKTASPILYSNTDDLSGQASKVVQTHSAYNSFMMDYRQTGEESYQLSDPDCEQITKLGESITSTFNDMMQEIKMVSDGDGDQIKDSIEGKYPAIFKYIQFSDCMVVVKEPDPKGKQELLQKLIALEKMALLGDKVNDHHFFSSKAEVVMNTSLADDAKIKGAHLIKIKEIGEKYIPNFNLYDWVEKRFNNLKRSTIDKYMLIAARKDCHPFVVLGAERLYEVCILTSTKIKGKIVQKETVPEFFDRNGIDAINENNIKETQQERIDSFNRQVEIIKKAVKAVRDIFKNEKVKQKLKENPNLIDKNEVTKQILDNVTDIEPKSKKDIQSICKQTAQKLIDTIVEKDSLSKNDVADAVATVKQEMKQYKKTHKLVGINEYLPELKDYFTSLKVIYQKPGMHVIPTTYNHLNLYLTEISEIITEILEITKGGEDK